MLTKKKKKRPSAEQILSSPWFETTMTESSVDSEVNKQIVSNLKNFHVVQFLISFKTNSKQLSILLSLLNCIQTKTNKTYSKFSNKSTKTEME